MVCIMWEYLIRNVSVIQDYKDELSEQELNNYGRLGWEMVTIVDNEVIFKREVREHR